MDKFFEEEFKKVRSIGNIFELRYEHLLKHFESEGVKDIQPLILETIKEISYIHTIAEGIEHDVHEHEKKLKLSGSELSQLHLRMTTWVPLFKQYIDLLESSFSPKNVKDMYGASDNMTAINSTAEEFKSMNTKVMNLLNILSYKY